ncbi:Penicillinase repressor [Posidoniimonas corsicana]|uniref:Penicillinase repressor n=1 Tax=Posidoniimonas corsicana TaxID=1938618 RepID=A0A5C5VB12_9BACT|nr:BlaI/MecI/CopY family transcriptional regulator [Posidoniimonas corsicana]TWT35163.1 Penicillinase repressor [Posidoniimonas corsicana]
MPPKPSEDQLSRRERQIMDAVYALKQATVTEVVEAIDDAPSRTTIRTLMRILEEKGHLKHKKQGREYLYLPTRARTRAGQSAMRRVLETFFGGSLEQAVATHLSDPSADLSTEELERIANLISQAKKEGKP